MDSASALRYVVETSGLTHRQIAHRLGRYDSYVSQVLTRSGAPGADTIATIARACGYRLELVPMDGGEAVTIGEAMADDADGASDRLVQARALVHRAAALLDGMDD